MLPGLRAVGAIATALAIVACAPIRPVAEVSPAEPARSCAGRGDPALPGNPVQARPATEPGRLIPAAMDPSAGRVVAIEMPATTLQAVTTWTFDVCTNTWTVMAPRTQPDDDMYQLVFDTAAGLTLAVPRWDGPIWTYSVVDDEWTRLPEPEGGPIGASDVVYDPVRDQVLAWNDVDATLWSFRLDANRWRQIPRFGSWPLVGGTGAVATNYTLMTFDTAIDRVVLVALPLPGRPAATWLFDPATLRWSQGRAEAPFVLLGYGEMGTEATYDAATGDTVIFSAGRLTTYNGAADRWDVPSTASWAGISYDTSQPPIIVNGRQERVDGLAIGPLARSGHTLVFDPLNERVIVVGGQSLEPDGPTLAQSNPYLMWASRGDTWAYDVRANEWTQLVAGRP